MGPLNYELWISDGFQGVLEIVKQGRKEKKWLWLCNLWESLRKLKLSAADLRRYARLRVDPEFERTRWSDYH